MICDKLFETGNVWQRTELPLLIIEFPYKSVNMAFKIEVTIDSSRGNKKLLFRI